jgi:hypothetical protein
MLVKDPYYWNKQIIAGAYYKVNMNLSLASILISDYFYRPK